MAATSRSGLDALPLSIQTDRCRQVLTDASSRRKSAAPLMAALLVRQLRGRRADWRPGHRAARRAAHDRIRPESDRIRNLGLAPRTLPQSRRLSTLRSGVGRQRRCCSRSGGAANATPKRARLAARAGQSGQRRTFAQHGCSGLGAVAGARQRPRRRPAHRGSVRRVDVGVALGQDAECRLFGSQAPRCPMEQKRLKDTLGLTPERVSGVLRAA